MKTKTTFYLVLCLAACSVLNSCKQQSAPLRVAIAPYQDIAMIENITPLKLDEKYHTPVQLLTMQWEDILPAISSAGNTADVGFGSLVEYLTQENNLNKGGDDDVVFIYPAYIFKGGGFVSLDKKIPVLDKSGIKDTAKVRAFLSGRIGAQKNSIYEMMIFSLANRSHVDYKGIKLHDLPLNDGIYALESKSLDLTSAGLTQINEISKQGGQVNLTMEDLGFADVTGFICKQKTYNEKKEQIDNLIRMWYDCVYYVMADPDKNSAFSRAYLKKNASTQYDLAQYKLAISQEYFPVSIAEVQSNILAPSGRFSYQGIAGDVATYLQTVKKLSKKPAVPSFIQIN